MGLIFTHSSLLNDATCSRVSTKPPKTYRYTWAVVVDVRCASVSYLNLYAEWYQSSPSVTFPRHFPSKRQNRRQNVRKGG